jgi:hypothetical protein
MPIDYSQLMMLPIDNQIYQPTFQPQQRRSLKFKQSNVGRQPPPNAQYIPYDSNTVGYPQQPQLPLKRERKPIIITDPNTHETINLKDKVQQKTEQTATTQLNTDNKQSITTSTSNRNINSQQQQQKSATSTTTSAPISTNTQEAKALQLEFSLSVLKKINESSNKTTTAAAAPTNTSTQQQQQALNNDTPPVPSTTTTTEQEQLVHNNNEILSNNINKPNVPKTAIAVGRNQQTTNIKPTGK